MPGTTAGRRVFWKTGLPGYYEVRFSQKDRTWRGGFAVNTAAIESDLRSVAAEDVEKAIKARSVAVFSAPDLWSSRSPGGIFAAGPQGREMAPFLALLALAACAAELLLANRFYRSP